MSFKFSTGQAVEYKPTGGMLGLYTVIRQMPEEFRAFDRKYRIKSEQEGFERTVLECDLQEWNSLNRSMPKCCRCAGKAAANRIGVCAGRDVLASDRDRATTFLTRGPWIESQQ